MFSRKMSRRRKRHSPTALSWLTGTDMNTEPSLTKESKDLIQENRTYRLKESAVTLKSEDIVSSSQNYCSSEWTKVGKELRKLGDEWTQEQTAKRRCKETDHAHQSIDTTKEYRIVIIGSTGSGKSCVGNMLVGQQVFESKLSSKSVTRKCQAYVSETMGAKISIIDTPGFVDSETSDTEMSKDIEMCRELSCPGAHAFLLVIRVSRLKENDSQIIQRYMDLFGDQLLDFTILVFTGCDDLERNRITLHQFMNEASPFFKDIIRKYRYIAIDGTSMDETAQRTLIEEIFALIEKNEGRYYEQHNCDIRRLKQNRLHCDQDKFQLKINRVIEIFHEIFRERENIQVFCEERNDHRNKMIKAIESALNDLFGTRTRATNNRVRKILNDNAIKEIFALSEREQEQLLYGISGKENHPNNWGKLEEKSH